MTHRRPFDIEGFNKRCGFKTLPYIDPDSLPYSVEQPDLDRYDDHDNCVDGHIERKKWCDEQCQRTWTTSTVFVSGKPVLAYRFASEKDAMLFKLTFG